MPMDDFPRSKDLAPGDMAMVTAVRANHRFQDAAELLGAFRKRYYDQAHQKCDVVLMAVPEGKGMEFARGLEEGWRQRGELQ